MSIRIPASQPNSAEFQIRYDKPERRYVLSRRSRTGLIHTISMTRDDVLAVTNLLVDLIEFEEDN